LEKNPNVVKAPAPQVLLSGLNDKAMTVNIQIWIDDVHNLQTTKSELLNSIFNGLAGQGVKVI